MRKAKRDRIWKELEECFDWECVRKTMKALKWKWASVEGEVKIEDLKRIARSEFDRVANLEMEDSSCLSCSTGGFKVIRWKGYMGAKDSFELLFIVSQTETE